MEKNEIVNLVASIGLMVFIGAIALIMVISSKIIDIRELVRKDTKKYLEKHQEWLFEQLYSMAPGKVLKPDEGEPKEASKPAVVYNPSKDPMREFNGTMNDWD